MKHVLIFVFLLLCLTLPENGVSGVDNEDVSVSRGDSVTLQTGVKTNQQYIIVWFYEGSRIAVIRGDLSYICTDVQCNNGTERFRDRLKLDHQTGSLTIMNTRSTDSGEYKLLISSSKSINEKIFTVAVHSVSGFDRDYVFASIGDSVTLQTGVKTNQQYRIMWFYEGSRIAIIRGDLGYICIDVQREEHAEQFRNRLKLDHQTGSLTIMNTRFADDGEYQLKINSTSGSISKKTFTVGVRGVYWGYEDDDEGSVSVIEGDSITLHTGVKTDQEGILMWFYEGSRIAAISGDLSYTCTDVQCDEDVERFRDRLKLDHQTGSLTIMNTRNTDDGEYQLQIFSSLQTIEKSFRVVVHDVHWVNQVKVEVSVTDGYPVTLHTDTTTKQHHKIKWYFNNICVAQIRGDLSYICTDVQCDEGAESFRDRLKLDHQTGSLIIMNTRNTDEGEYKLEIISNRGSRTKIFRVLVDDSGMLLSAVPTIYVVVAAAVLLLAAAVSGVICCCYCKCKAKRKSEYNIQKK